MLFINRHKGLKIKSEMNKGMGMQLETDKILIGKKIKEYRKRKHLTQAQLAELVDLNEKQIYRIESGLNHPTYLTFAKIISVLDIDINDFSIDVEIKSNPLLDNILHIANNASEVELKTYFDVISAIHKNLSAK